MPALNGGRPAWPQRLLAAAARADVEASADPDDPDKIEGRVHGQLFLGCVERDMPVHPVALTLWLFTRPHRRPDLTLLNRYNEVLPHVRLAADEEGRLIVAMTILLTDDLSDAHLEAQFAVWRHWTGEALLQLAVAEQDRRKRVAAGEG